MSALVQGTQEWLDYRKTKIGASDAPIIMGVSPYSTIYELWMSKNDYIPDIYQHDGILEGKKCEDEVRMWFALETGIQVAPRVMVHSSLDWMIASLDGLSADNKTAVEIKRPGPKDHAKALARKIPEKYFPQLQHQLEVLALDELFYYSFDGKDGVLLKVGRDDRYIKTMVRKETEFMECLQEFRAPAMTDRDYHLRNDDVWKQTAVSFMDAQAELKKWEAREKELRGSLLTMASQQNTIGAGLKLTKCVRQGVVDYSSVPELQGIDLDAYRKEPSEYWKVTAV